MPRVEKDEHVVVGAAVRDLEQSIDHRVLRRSHASRRVEEVVLVRQIRDVLHARLLAPRNARRACIRRYIGSIRRFLTPHRVQKTLFVSI